VPREAAHVGLVEVVDVEYEHAGAVHVGPEVVGVHVSLDPHPAGLSVQERIPILGEVAVEQRRAPPVEGEGRAGHLAELPAPRVGVTIGWSRGGMWMPKYVIVRHFDVGAAGMPEVGSRSRRVIEDHFPDITWHHSHIAVEDDGRVRTFCIYEAPDIEAVMA